MFSKKSATKTGHSPSRSVTNPMAGASFSVLGADISVKGDIRATADLHIDGQIEGDITCANLVQGEHSAISGSIIADSAQLAGAVQGSIKVGTLVILRTARIDGDVHYETLSIEEGAEIDGRLSHRHEPLAITSSEEPRLILAS